MPKDAESEILQSSNLLYLPVSSLGGELPLPEYVKTRTQPIPFTSKFSQELSILIARRVPRPIPRPILPD